MKCKNCKGRGYVITLDPDYRDLFQSGAGSRPLIECPLQEFIDQATTEQDCPTCKGKGTVDGPTFHFDVSGVQSLTVDQIWPDGDHPDDPTPQDVARAIQENRATHTLSGLLTDWNLDMDCLSLTITTSNGSGLVDIDDRLKVTRGIEHRPYACKRCRSVDGCACKVKAVQG